MDFMYSCTTWVTKKKDGKFEFFHQELNVGRGKLLKLLGNFTTI